MEYQIAMALGPDDPGDGDPGRQQRGRTIAALADLGENRLAYRVPSQSDKGSYLVMNDGEPFCTCPVFEKRQRSCRHVYAVEFLIQGEERPYGTTIEPKPSRRQKPRPTWPVVYGRRGFRVHMLSRILMKPGPLTWKIRKFPFIPICQNDSTFIITLLKNDNVE